MSVATQNSAGATRTRSRGSYAIHALEDAMRVLEAISEARGEGIASLAVPLFRSGGRAVGSPCLVIPEFRFDEEKVESTLLPHLRGAGETVSARLGYHGKELRMPHRPWS